MTAQRIPGLALAIVEGDWVAYLRGFGKADDSAREGTPKTPFIIRLAQQVLKHTGGIDARPAKCEQRVIAFLTVRGWARPT
jgi:hypothetical protein